MLQSAPRVRISRHSTRPCNLHGLVGCQAMVHRNDRGGELAAQHTQLHNSRFALTKGSHIVPLERRCLLLPVVQHGEAMWAEKLSLAIARRGLQCDFSATVRILERIAGHADADRGPWLRTLGHDYRQAIGVDETASFRKLTCSRSASIIGLSHTGNCVNAVSPSALFQADLSISKTLPVIIST